MGWLLVFRGAIWSGIRRKLLGGKRCRTWRRCTRRSNLGSRFIRRSVLRRPSQMTVQDCVASFSLSLLVGVMFQWAYSDPDRNLLTRGLVAFMKALSVRGQDPRVQCLVMAVISYILMLMSLVVCIVKRPLG